MQFHALLVAVLLAGVDTFNFLRDQGMRRCEKVKSSTCLTRVHQAYNSTQFPNLLSHKSQEEALYELKHYDPLINIDCSKHLATFLCALYLPICTENYRQRIIPPCRSLCKQSMLGCSPVMEEFGVKWRFDCQQFPEGKTEMCVGNVDEGKSENLVKDSEVSGKHRKGWLTGKPNDELKLECSNDKVIYIRKIRHSVKSNCCPIATKAVISAMCNGKEACSLHVSQETFGGHCNDNVGNIKLKYKCIQKLDNYIKPCGKKSLK